MKNKTFKITYKSKRTGRIVARHVSADTAQDAISKINSSIPACFHWATQTV